MTRQRSLQVLQNLACTATKLGSSAATQSRLLNTRTPEKALEPARIQWVFLGPPGVGKGTYSTRVAVALGVAHIAAGDLVRAEIKRRSPLGQQLQTYVNKGELLPDEIVSKLLYQRIEKGKTMGEKGFVLDGFPRTAHQARHLVKEQEIQLAVSLQLREEVLIEKCMGRRICKKCGKGWNVADIHRPATDSLPEIIMPPLDPPAECLEFMEQRDDDKEEVIRNRLDVYHREAEPVETFFKEQGSLLNFEITQGIPETLPGLLGALKPHIGNWEIADVDNFS